MVENDSGAVAAVISAADFESFQRLLAERRDRFKALEATWQAFEDVPDDELEREVSRAVAAVREANRQRGRRVTSSS